MPAAADELLRGRHHGSVVCMSGARYIREAIRILKDLGCQVEYVQNSHAKVYVTANDREFIWTASTTPSDWRNSRNAFAKLRRELRASGIEPPRFGLRGPLAQEGRFDDLWAFLEAVPQDDGPGEP